MIARVSRNIIDSVKRLVTPKKKLLVILGAGSSVEMGMPSVAAIDTLMKKWRADWANVIGKSDYLDYVWRRVDTYHSAGAPSGATSANFERVLGEMVALTNWVTPAPHGSPLSAVVNASVLPSSMKFSTTSGYGPAVDINSNVVAVMKELARHMRELSARLELTLPAFGHYKSLLDFFRGTFDVGIYNLNYDTVALSAWPDAFTGFGSDGKFDPRGVHRRRGWGFIYHLHGSVHHSLSHPFGNEMLWQSNLTAKFDDGDIGRSGHDVSDGKTLPKTSLIAGGFKLDQLLADPFQTFYASLVRHVHEADAILLGGYGFGDTHVNEAISHCRSAGRPRLPVMVLDYARPKTDPMEFRHDEWSIGLCGTLRAAAKDFKEPGHHAPPVIAELVAKNGFEVSEPQKVAIWHGGFTASTRKADAIVSWLSQVKKDIVLAGTA